jgi:hypothetical protein
MEQFSGDDEGYLRWLSGHPAGYVLNVRANPNQNYAVLHRAACPTISAPRDDGAYTDRGYRKAVATNLDDLRAFARSIGREDGSFSSACSRCKPL